MKHPLILKQPGIQVRLSELPSDDKIVTVQVVSREMPDVIDSSFVEVRALRVLGNEQVVKWLDSE
jgi:hypothetical protein